MARPLLPPRGYFIPTRAMFDPELADPLKLTWIQLRALAWTGQTTQPMPIKKLADITGKTVTTLYRHLAELRDWGALRWRPTGSGTLIVLFPSEYLGFPKTEENGGDSVPIMGNDPVSQNWEPKNWDSQFWDTYNHDHLSANPSSQKELDKEEEKGEGLI